MVGILKARATAPGRIPARRDHRYDPGLPAKVQALIAMAEARLGHRDKAETALANYRRLWAEANPKASTTTPLLAEVEQRMSEAFKDKGTNY